MDRAATEETQKGLADAELLAGMRAGQSAAFAARVWSETPPDAPPTARIERAFLLAFARPPCREELRACAAFLDQQAAVYRAEKAPPRETAIKALAGLCHMLFCANEFLYIE